MSIPPIVKPGNDPAGNAEAVTDSTSLTHPAGGVLSASAEKHSMSSWMPKFFQKVPDTPIEDFLCRLTEIGSLTVDSGDAALGVLANWDPWSMFLANAAVAEKTKNFSLIQGTLEVVIVTTMPGGAFGSYCWTALPNGGVTTDQDCARELIPENVMQTDHWTRVDCANSENVVMQLEWLWPYDFAALPAGPTESWKLYCICLAAVTSGVNSAGVTGYFKAYARLLPGYRLTVPRFQSRKGKLVDSTSVKNFVTSARENKTISKTASAVGDVADKLRGIPVIGEAATAVSWAAHGVAEVASWFGFTRETDERHPMPISMRSVTNVAHMDGADSNDVAALTATTRISIDPSLVGGPENDVAANASLFARWTLVKLTTWLTTNVTGDILFSIPVSPFYGRGGYDVNNGHILPVAGYVGMPFTWWRGDMEYKIIIPVSKFHRGSIQLFWAPFGSSPSGAISNVTLNYIIDVSAEGEKNVTVGFARDVPFIPKILLDDEMTIMLPGYSNGMLYGRVVNPLTCASTTGDAQILIFARGGSNMDFQLPAISYSLENTEGLQTYDLTRGLMVYQGALGDGVDGDEDSFPLVDSSGTYPSEQIQWGERFASVRALMQKPTRLLMSNNFLPPQAAAKHKFVIPCLGPSTWLDQADFPGIIQFTWQNWYRPLFTGIACSERFKMIPSRDCYLGAAPIDQPVADTYVDNDDAPSFSTTLAPMTFCGANRGAEIMIPYYQMKKYLLGRRFYNPHDATRVNVIYHSTGYEDATQEVAVYHSYGEDIRLTNFRQCPYIREINALVPHGPDFQHQFFQGANR